MANLILELWRAGEVAQQLRAGVALQWTWVQFAAPTCSSQPCAIQLQGSKALFWSPQVPSTHVISRHTCQQNSYTHQIVILRNFSKLKKQKVKTLTANGEVCESFFPTHQKPTLLRTRAVFQCLLRRRAQHRRGQFPGQAVSYLMQIISHLLSLTLFILKFCTCFI